MTSNNDPPYTDFEHGERSALLQIRSFIAKHGKEEVDSFCQQRLHDIMMDARPRLVSIQKGKAHAPEQN